MSDNEQWRSISDTLGGMINESLGLNVDYKKNSELKRGVLSVLEKNQFYWACPMKLGFFISLEQKIRMTWSFILCFGGLEG